MHVTVNFWDFLFGLAKYFSVWQDFHVCQFRMTDNFSASFGKSDKGCYRFKLFTLELKNNWRFATNIFFSKFIIISYTIMHESEITECYFFLHLLHQNSCLVFVKKHSPLFSSWIVSLLTSLFTEWISSNNHLEMFFSWGIWFSLPTCKLPEPTWIVCVVFR